MFGKEIQSRSMNYYGITNAASLEKNGETKFCGMSHAVFGQQT